MTFLNAKWTNLAMANYEVAPEVLKDYLPAGTELDLWNGKCYVSLVGFLFEDVRLLGLKIPFHTDFEEVNLRFYVKHLENNEWKRGVAFIKEIVPKHALTLVANTIYNENYQTLPMQHQMDKKADANAFAYQWKKGGKWNRIVIETAKNATEIQPNTEAEFITEHYFGYTKANGNTTYEYGVNHPKWQQYEVTDYTIDVDFKATYGNRFAFLDQQQPAFVLLAEGSKIKVGNKKKIKL